MRATARPSSRSSAPRDSPSCSASLQARVERGRDQRFEVAAAELGIRILAGDDLALLGDAQAARDASRRLREDRLVARPAAAADRAAAAVEQAQLHAVRRRRVDQRALGAIERPVRRQVAAVLVAVGIAEHHLLPVGAARDVRPIERQRERCAHRRRRSASRSSIVSNSGTILTASAALARRARPPSAAARPRAGPTPTGISRSRSSAARPRRNGAGCRRRRAGSSSSERVALRIFEMRRMERPRTCRARARAVSTRAASASAA